MSSWSKSSALEFTSSKHKHTSSCSLSPIKKYHTVKDVSLLASDNDAQLMQQSTNTVLPNMTTMTLECGSTVTHTHTQSHSQSTSRSHSQSQSQSPSKSISKLCRYCYHHIPLEKNASQCHCTGLLCQTCLANEVSMTQIRGDRIPQCTVCKYEYDLETDFNFIWKRDCNDFFLNFFTICGFKHDTYLFDDVVGKIGYFSIISGLSVWILSTTLLFIYRNDGRCPLLIYYLLAIFDFFVTLAELWFVSKTRWSVSLYLFLLYSNRCFILFMGWLPSLNLFGIHVYQEHYFSIMWFFIVSSFVSSLAMMFLTVVDLREQIHSYIRLHGITSVGGVTVNVNANEENITAYTI